MQADDFDRYRACFYWFQLQFFVRSGFESKTDKLASFLYDLYTNDTETHFRWTPQKRVAVTQRQDLFKVKRPPRGMKQADAMKKRWEELDAMPVESSTTMWLPRAAEDKSIRCRYMLFDWLLTRNGKKWNNFDSLYRALIVFDLRKAGYSFNEIENNWNDDQALSEMNEHRLLLNVEKYSRIIKECCNLYSIKLPIDPYSPTSSNFFNYTGYNQHDGKQAARLFLIKAKAYYKRAEDLSKLARNGKFKSISLLPPIKS